MGPDRPNFKTYCISDPKLAVKPHQGRFVQLLVPRGWVDFMQLAGGANPLGPWAPDHVMPGRAGPFFEAGLLLPYNRHWLLLRWGYGCLWLQV